LEIHLVVAVLGQPMVQEQVRRAVVARRFGLDLQILSLQAVEVEEDMQPLLVDLRPFQGQQMLVQLALAELEVEVAHKSLEELEGPFQVEQVPNTKVGMAAQVEMDMVEEEGVVGMAEEVDQELQAPQEVEVVEDPPILTL
jgi:hypothetical protein